MCSDSHDLELRAWGDLAVKLNARVKELETASAEALDSLDHIWAFSMHPNDYPEQRACFENALRVLRGLQKEEF